METIEDVVIVGAGIAGLTTALGLHRHGIRSLVLESSATMRITGFAFSTWTNAWKALDAIGIGDSLRKHHVLLDGVTVSSVVSGQTEEELSFYNMSEGEQRVREIRCMKRKVLLEALMEELPSDTIRYSSKVVYVEESGYFKLLQLADGTVIKTKVLIGCDGVNSVVAKWLGLKPAAFSGRSGIRGYVDFKSAHGFRPKFQQFIGNGIRAGFIPCDDQCVYWFFTWTPSSTQAHLRYRKPWELLWGNISRGNVTVVGDALHPMTPDLGQGACSALEDGIVLARCLSEALKSEGLRAEAIEDEMGKEYRRIEMALQKYAKERRWRSFDLVSTSLVNGLIQQGTGKVVSFLRNRFLGKHLAGLLMKKSDFDCGNLTTA